MKKKKRKKQFVFKVPDHINEKLNALAYAVFEDKETRSSLPASTLLGGKEKYKERLMAELLEDNLNAMLQHIIGDMKARLGESFETNYKPWWTQVAEQRAKQQDAKKDH